MKDVLEETRNSVQIDRCFGDDNVDFLSRAYADTVADVSRVRSLFEAGVDPVIQNQQRT